jgi:hypothetical protein
MSGDHPAMLIHHHAIAPTSPRDHPGDHHDDHPSDHHGDDHDDPRAGHHHAGAGAP